MDSINLRFRQAFEEVNAKGFSVVKLGAELPPGLQAPLYKAMNSIDDPNRSKPYNEVAFSWPADWEDIVRSYKQVDIEAVRPAMPPFAGLIAEKVGPLFAQVILHFSNQVREWVVAHHFGLDNNELRLAQVTVRQITGQDGTEHLGSDLYEDPGQDDLPDQHLLSAIVTTYGTPVEGVGISPKIGDLILFNSLKRNKLLGISDGFQLVHQGTKPGPKLFFIFKFVGPLR